MSQTTYKYDKEGPFFVPHNVRKSRRAKRGLPSTYGRIGAHGLTPIKERQYEKGHALTTRILKRFEVIEAILRDKPKRQFFIFHPLAYGL